MGAEARLRRERKLAREAAKEVVAEKFRDSSKSLLRDFGIAIFGLLVGLLFDVSGLTENNPAFARLLTGVVAAGFYWIVISNNWVDQKLATRTGRRWMKQIYAAGLIPIVVGLLFCWLYEETYTPRNAKYDITKWGIQPPGRAEWTIEFEHPEKLSEWKLILLCRASDNSVDWLDSPQVASEDFVIKNRVEIAVALGDAILRKASGAREKGIECVTAFIPRDAAYSPSTYFDRPLLDGRDLIIGRGTQAPMTLVPK